MINTIKNTIIVLLLLAVVYLLLDSVYLSGYNTGFMDAADTDYVCEVFDNV